MITENIRQIRENLDKINADIQIVAATKTRSIDEIKECMSTGAVIAAGENRVQELTEKYTSVFRWDFIGRLQTNKVKYIIDKVQLIHGLDRIELAETIQKQCLIHNKTMDALIEINTGEEESKGGILLNELDDFCSKIVKFDRIKIRGMMAVAPIYYSENELFKTFSKVYDVFEKRRTKDFDILSMGMSADYLIAAKCGATMVRPGRAIFGERNK